MEISRVSREEWAPSASISETETSGPGDGCVSGPRKGERWWTTGGASPDSSMVKGAPQSWTEACFAGFAEPVQTKQIFEAEKHDEDRECAKYTSCLTMATDVQFRDWSAPTDW